MAVLETHIFKAHNNIYIEQPEENYRTREIRTEMVFPDCVNENTGMLVLIPGYGGNIDSHVFRKMREVFAEQYNFITVQCDYFGNRFMDSNEPEEMRLIADMKNIVNAEIYYRMNGFESEDEFNDMGLMQALDIVSTTIYEYLIMKEEKYRYNDNLYNLSFLYQNIKNKCKIIALQGTDDWMVDVNEKDKFISQLDNAQLLIIHPDEVDGVLCKNADHGLGLDFFKFFEIVIPSLDKVLGQPKLDIQFPKEAKVGNEETYIKIGYENGLPELKEITW